MTFLFTVQNNSTHGVDSFQSTLTQRDAAKGLIRQLTAHCYQQGRLIPFRVPSLLHIPAPYMPQALGANVIPHMRLCGY